MAPTNASAIRTAVIVSNYNEISDFDLLDKFYFAYDRIAIPIENQTERFQLSWKEAQQEIIENFVDGLDLVETFQQIRQCWTWSIPNKQGKTGKISNWMK